MHSSQKNLEGIYIYMKLWTILPFYKCKSEKVKWTKNLALEKVDLKFYKSLHCADITSIFPDNVFAPHALKI